MPPNGEVAAQQALAAFLKRRNRTMLDMLPSGERAPEHVTNLAPDGSRLTDTLRSPMASYAHPAR